MIVAQLQPPGDPLAEAAEVFADSLVDRLQGLETVACGRCMNADALRAAVVDSDGSIEWRAFS